MAERAIAEARRANRRIADDGYTHGYGVEELDEVGSVVAQYDFRWEEWYSTEDIYPAEEEQ